MTIGGISISVGILIIAAGVLLAIFGILLLINHSGYVKIILGIVLAAAGLGAAGVGYTLDQRTEVTYTVSAITSLNNNDTQFRITLKNESGADTIIYVDDKQVTRFKEGEEVTMTKREVGNYREQK